MKFNLTRRKETWVLTWRAWLAALLLIVLLVILFFRTIHPFLSINCAVPSDYLVIEGWLNESSLKQAVEEFQKNRYKRIIIIGEPLPENSLLPQFADQPQLCAELLVRKGIEKEVITSLVIGSQKKDRTYASARALKTWFLQHKVSVRSVNVFTYDTHGRRSRFLFRKALGKTIEVGVISAKNTDYDTTRWWTTSRGVRAVLPDVVAYIYAVFFFFPDR